MNPIAASAAWFGEDGRVIFGGRSEDRRRQEEKERESERKGRKDARSHLECMQLALFRAMFMRGEATGSLPSGNNVARCRRECKRGSALAYCLKLLIGLRSDTAFPRYAVLLPLSLSFSLFLPLCASLIRIHRLLSLSVPVSASSASAPAPTSSVPIVDDDARPSSPIGETKS